MYETMKINSDLTQLPFERAGFLSSVVVLAFVPGYQLFKRTLEYEGHHPLSFWGPHQLDKYV